MPNAIDLDGLEPAYTNPKQMLYEAGGGISKAMARLLDKVSAKLTFSAKSESTLGVTPAGTVIKTGTSFNASISYSSNFSDWMKGVERTGSSDGLPSPIQLDTKASVTESVTFENSVLGVVTANNTLSFDSKDGYSNKKSVSGPLVFGVITSATFSVTESSNKTSYSFEVTPRLGDALKVPFSIGGTTNDKGLQSVDLKVGFQLQGGIGATKFSLGASGSLSVNQ